MKKTVAAVLAVLFLLGFAGCIREESYTLNLTIPAGNQDAVVYTHEAVRPKGDVLKISAGAGIAEAEMILLPAEENMKQESFSPVILRQRHPVKIKVEKGSWYYIGIRKENPSDVPAAAEIIVSAADIRIE